VLAKTAREIVGATNVGFLTGGGGTNTVDEVVSFTGGGSGGGTRRHVFTTEKQ
jgi:hypothetical protein